MHTTPLIERGSVLLSLPGPLFIDQPYFHKAVILIAEHDESQGSRGFILNRQTPLLDALGPGVDMNVWYGGPCGSLDEHPTEQMACCLHCRADLSAKAPVVQGVYLAAPEEAWAHIAAGSAKPDDFMYFVGHCEWSPQELQRELDTGKAWRMVAADADTLFRSLPLQRRAIRRGRGLLGSLGSGRGLVMWRRLFQQAALLAPVEPETDEVLDGLADDALSGWAEGFSNPEGPCVGEGQPPQVERSPPILAILHQILAVMASSPESALTQEQGCEAMTNLIVDSDTCATVVAHGGVEPALEAMRAHPDSAGVQGHCCGTLTYFANNEVARAQLAASGLGMVVDAMRRYPNSTLVQYKGCGMLANFCVGSVEQEMAAGAGAVQVALAAMEQHMNDREVQNYCCGTLYNLAKRPDNLATISSSGGVHAVQQAMERHPEATTVREVGPELLRLLWQDSAERSMLE